MRKAILDANASSGTDAITFQSGLTGTISLTSGQMTITESLTITGNGASSTVIDAQLNSRIFSVSAGNVTLKNLTLKNGRVTNGPGGAIVSTSSGTLTISQSTLADNSTTAYGQGGGAIMTSSGAATISRSTLSGNSTSGVAAEGGAIKSESEAVTILNSTLSGNEPPTITRTAGRFTRIRDPSRSVKAPSPATPPHRPLGMVRRSAGSPVTSSSVRAL